MWKTRIGNTRPIAIFLLISIGLLTLTAMIVRLPTAIANQNGPHEYTVQELVNGNFVTNQHVSVSGYILYDSGYVYGEGAVDENHYLFLADLSYPTNTTNPLYMVAVDTIAAPLSTREYDRVTIVGMTYTPSSDLATLLKEDKALLQDEYLINISSDLYISEGAKPPTVQSSFGVIAFGLFALALCTIPFFFDRVEFKSSLNAINATDAKIKGRDGGQLALWGKLPRLHEPVQGRPYRKKNGTKFVQNKPVALLTGNNDELLIYGEETSYGRYGTSKTDYWGLHLNPKRVVNIAPGSFKGWHEHLAVRITYLVSKNKAEEIYLLTDSKEALTELLKYLQSQGFAIKFKN